MEQCALMICDRTVNGNRPARCATARVQDKVLDQHVCMRACKTALSKLLCARPLSLLTVILVRDVLMLAIFICLARRRAVAHVVDPVGEQLVDQPRLVLEDRLVSVDRKAGESGSRSQSGAIEREVCCRLGCVDVAGPVDQLPHGALEQ